LTIDGVSDFIQPEITVRGYCDRTRFRSLGRLIDIDAFAPVFQPIVDLLDGAIFGHEALIRGAHHMPADLLRLAADASVLEEFEMHCVELALRRDDGWRVDRYRPRLTRHS
jgi:EAL domain-containing protein (putative c-di-GMP-specific phosphodiesterase class I)